MKISRNKVILILAEKELTVTELAVLYGSSRERVSAIINGRPVRPDTAGRLAKALGVSVVSILGDEYETRSN